MRRLVILLILTTGFRAWAGNGVERDEIDVGNVPLSREMRVAVSKELARLCPGRRGVVQEGFLARIHQVDIGQDGYPIYEIIVGRVRRPPVDTMLAAEPRHVLHLTVRKQINFGQDAKEFEVQSQDELVDICD